MISDSDAAQAAGSGFYPSDVVSSGSGVGLMSLIQLGMVGHSLISGAMFMIVGYLVECYGKRSVQELSKVWCNSLRLLGLLFFVLLLANGSFPSTVLFLVECGCLSSLAGSSMAVVVCIACLSSLSLVSGVVIWYRVTQSKAISVDGSVDIDRLVLVIVILLIVCISLGCCLFLVSCSYNMH